MLRPSVPGRDLDDDTDSGSQERLLEFRTDLDGMSIWRSLPDLTLAVPDPDDIDLFP